jgi:signal transduction histidine kinase/CheY-like chemotaxis protein
MSISIITKLLQRTGIWTVVIFITVFATMASLAIATVIYHFILKLSIPAHSLIISVACPVIISPIISVVILKLIVEVEEQTRKLGDTLKALEENNTALDRARRSAETASHAKTRFLASASHDLRQPIHTLSLFGAALMLRPLDASTREIAQHLNTALQVLASQMDALLDISKLDAGVVRVSMAQLELRSMLDRVLKECLPAARDKGIDIALECPADACIETDRLLFERVVRNLLDNAIKYTDTGHVKLSVTPDADGCTIAIADTGRGIPDADQARIFEEFYQLDNSERDRTRGLGLGLAIVRRLTELLAIRMEMTSETGRGTTFRLFLPIALPRAPLGSDKDIASSAPHALHVLVVDDEAGIRLGMKMLLEAMGCRATLTDGTRQAVAAVIMDKPDIILSDMRLRGEDSGIEVVRTIRRIYPNVPAVLVSGDIAPERLRQAEAAGIPLLHKPVPIEMLKQAISNACGQQGSIKLPGQA